MTFLPKFIRWIPFTSGDYWVLKLDPLYKVSLVGTPNRKYLWLLARDRNLAQEIRDEYLAEAKRQRYDIADLIIPRHTGREVTDDMLSR